MPIFRPSKPKTKVSVSANVAMATGTTLAPWDVLDYEEGVQMYDPGTPTDLVIPMDGLYLVQAFYGRRSVSSSVAWAARLLVNSTTTIGSRHTNSTATQEACLAMAFDLLAGDVVQLAFDSLGATWNLSGPPNPSSCLSVVRIGPKRWT